MGHRHTFGTSQLFEIDSDQSWNYAEQPYVHLAAGVGVTESSSLVYPVENPSIDGTHFHSHWNHVPRSNGYASSSQNVELPHYQPEASAPSRNPFLHPTDYGPHATSSNYSEQTFHGVEGGFFDLTMGDGRGPYKRKSPGVPAACERGSTSRYHDAGSSSNLSLSSDKWQEKPNADFHHTPWDYPTNTPSYRGNSLSIGGEGTLRNVRSRATLDLEANLARTHLSSNPSRHSYTANQPIDHSDSADLSSHSSNASSWEWNNTLISPPTHDTSVFNHETNHLVTGRSNLSASLEIGGYNNNFASSINHVPQNLQGTFSQSARGVRSSYSQRSAPTFGVGSSSSSNMRLTHAANPDEGLQLAESYSSRHPRPFSNIGWRNNDRSGRTRISSERYRLHSDDAGFHDRLGPEGVMIMDRSNFYGSRNLFDQHRDMRLDVDDMSYEELLALGERIGNVNTGLSEDLISKCLTESIYCSSDRCQDEGKCVICLEEYKNMDDVGMLRGCRHDFHAGCIRKWLAMKNICPICKSAAMADYHVAKK